MERGNERFAQGDLAQAVQLFQEAARIDPGNMRAWEGLAAAQWRSGGSDAALAIWRNLVTIEPSIADRYETLGMAELEVKQYEAAAAHLKDALRLDPQRPRVRLKLGEACEALDAREEAAEQYRLIMAADPEEAGALVRWGRLLDRQGKLREERDLLAAAVERAPSLRPRVGTTLARLESTFGDAAYESGDYAQAVRCFEAASAWAPENAAIAANLGWAARRGGDGDRALQAWRHGVTLETSDRPALLRHIGDLHRERAEVNEAMASYRQAYELDPANDYLMVRLAEIAISRQDWSAAQSLFKTLFSLPSPDDGDAVRIAAAFVRNDQAARGLSLLDPFLGADSRVPGAGQAMARLLVELGNAAFQAERTDEGIDFYQRALRGEPANRHALRNLGWSYWRGRQWDACAATWRAYAAAYPELAEAHDLLAQIYLTQGAFGDAVKESRVSLEQNPEPKVARIHLTRGYLGNGEFAKATDLAGDLAREFPDDREVQQILAISLTKVRDYPAAMGQWRHVLDLNPTSRVAQVNWVRAMYESGHQEEALTEAARLGTQVPPSMALLELLAQDAVAQKDFAGGARWYRELARYFPRRPHYWIEVARCVGKCGLGDERQSVMREASLLFPDAPQVRAETAAALAADGRFGAALREYENLVTAFPDNSATYLGYLDAQESLGRFDDALATLGRNQKLFLSETERLLREARLQGKGAGSAAGRAVLARITAANPNRHYVPIVVYHGLSRYARTLNMSTNVFEAHMAALAGAGYQALRIGDLTRMLKGERPFPDKPILITFDDARTDSLEMADPVLARHGLCATMFVPTGRIRGEDHFHASWKTMQGLAATGRWEFQDHSHQAHDDVPIDPDGGQGPFLACRAWTEAEGRLETSAEFRQRIDTDYRTSKALLEEHFPGTPIVAYAFPFSDFGQIGGNEPAAASVNETICQSLFQFGMVQNTSGFNALEAGGKPPFFLWRLAVPPEWSDQDLLGQLARAAPENAAAAMEAHLLAGDGYYQAARQSLEGLGRREPLLTDDVREKTAYIAYWEKRPRESAQLLGTNAAPVESDLDLLRQLNWENKPQVAAGGSFSHDSDSRSVDREFLRWSYPLSSPVDLEAEAARVSLREAGKGSLSGSEVQLSPHCAVGHHMDLWPWLRARNMSDSTEALNGGVRSEFSYDRHSLWAGWSREDLDTVAAREAGLDYGMWSGSYTYRAPRWRWSGRVAHRDISDHNTRDDQGVEAYFSQATWRGWECGARIDHSDSRRQSELYYAPENVTAPSLVVGYQQHWRDDSAMVAETSLGMAFGGPGGDRLVSRGRLSATKAWTARWRTTFDVNYDLSPDYNSAGVSVASRWQL